MKRHQTGLLNQALLIVVIVVLAVLYLCAALGLIDSNVMRIMLSMCLYCAMGTMWNLMSGHCGLTSLGQQSFVGLAGYTLAVMTTYYSLPYGAAIIVGGILSALLALGLSLVFFRMRGMYFAVATWITAEALKTIFTSWGFVKKGAGMTVKLRPYPTTMEIFILALTLAIVATLVVHFLLKSRTGLGLSAMGNDADAASSVGVNIFKSKLVCFVLAGFFTGIAGVIFYMNKGSIFPTGGFSIEWTVSIVFIVIIGGVGTSVGPIVGSIIYVLLSEFLSKYPGWSNIILGIIAIVVIVVMPDGIVGTLQKKFHFEIMSLRRHAPE